MRVRAAFGRLPARIRIDQYFPQEQVLPRYDLVVCHGGSGSLLGALAHGLPSVPTKVSGAATVERVARRRS